MIVVTAPTGRIGSKLVPLLLQGDEPVRVIVRNPEKLPDAVRAAAEVVVGSHRDRDVVDGALAGADALFWLMPAAGNAASPYDAYVTASIPGADAVIRHHVPRVVVISALGRGTQMYAGHISASHAMEDLFRSTGAHLRALAMPTFMDNLFRQLPGIRNGTVTGTIPGDLRMPWVATRDIAEVAARYLRDHTWTGQETVNVLGAEDLSYDDIAATLADVLGRPMTYTIGDRDADRQALLGYGFSEAMAQSVIDMDIAGERGINNHAARTRENSTRTTFRSFAEDALKPALGM